MKNNYKFWFVFALVIVFAAGVTAGILCEKYILNPKPERIVKKRNRVPFPTLDIMAHELNLTAQQEDKIREIFKNNEERLRTLRREIHERFSFIRTQLKDEIKNVLTGEQNRKFEAMIEEHMSRRKKFGKKARRDKRERP